jgi:hypothetical protein
MTYQANGITLQGDLVGGGNGGEEDAGGKKAKPAWKQSNGPVAPAPVSVVPLRSGTVPVGGSGAGGYPSYSAPSYAAPAAQAAPAPVSYSAPAAAPARNYASDNPDVRNMVNAYTARLAQLKNRPALDPTYTSRAIASARGEINDAAAGQEERARQAAEAQGRTGGGALPGRRSRISEAAARAGNKAAVDISLARTRDEENNALARDAMENAFTLGGSTIATAPANLALAQQGLGLQQELGLGNLALGQGNLALSRDQFNAGRDDNRLSTLLALMNQLPSYGYAGF